MKKFGDILRYSIKEYKSYFKVFFIFTLFFLFIPDIILFFLEVPLKWNLSLLGKNPNFLDVNRVVLNYKFIFILMIFEIIAILLSVFTYCSYTYLSLSKKKNMKFTECFNGGKKYFVKYLKFNILAGIFLALLFLLLFIPGIIFLVYWIFSSFILINENKGIEESLKSSRKLVKGRWWKTLGHLLLFFLFIIILSIIIFFIPGTINYYIENRYEVSYNVFFLTNLIIQLFNFFFVLIATPIGVFFIKNLYLEYKHK